MSFTSRKSQILKVFCSKTQLNFSLTTETFRQEISMFASELLFPQYEKAVDKLSVKITQSPNSMSDITLTRHETTCRIWWKLTYDAGPKITWLLFPFSLSKSRIERMKNVSNRSGVYETLTTFAGQ